MGIKRNLLLNYPIHYNLNGKAACGIKSRKTATKIEYVTCRGCLSWYKEAEVRDEKR